MTACAGSRDHVLQERLDEYTFHRTYLRVTAMNVHILGRLLAKYAAGSIKFVNEDLNKNAWDMDSTFYRCEDIDQENADSQGGQCSARGQTRIVEGQYKYT